MKRRARPESAKSRRRKAAAPKSGAARPVSTLAAARKSDIVRLSHELAEARQQRIATADVLRIISSSSGNLERVFETILENAVRICECKFANLLLVANNGFRIGAMHGAPIELQEAFAREPSTRPNSPAGTVFRTKATVHIPDVRTYEHFSTMRVATLGGARTLLTVPMLRAKELVGAIAIYRQEVRPFSDNQIELIQNFAAQAVIAIENARLLNELRGSLDRQTATSEVLGVISKSPGDLEPIYQAILENATRICEAKFGVLNLHENGALRMGAMHNVPTAFAAWLQGRRGAYKPIEGSLPDRVMRTKQVSYTADNAAEANPGRAATLGGARSTVTVPMLKDEELVGTITIYRQEVRPFTDKQIELLQNFAAQAVIAIENARLLNELRQRTTDLGEALE
jgi:GAF domain-containing protein